MCCSLYCTALLLLVGRFATLCLGQNEREIVDLCKNSTGEIQQYNKIHKTWHFVSSECSLNGTLRFFYVNISEYIWNPKVNITRNRLRVTDIPTPMWERGKEDRVPSVQISNTYSAVLTYDGRYGTTGQNPYFKIRYEFEIEYNYEKTNEPSSQFGTYRALTITFAVLFFITIFLLLIATLRLRQVVNDSASNMTNEDHKLEDTYADIDSQRSATGSAHEIRVNDLYHL